MRTTVEISDRQRSILLSLAAQRGLRGYSEIVQEALDNILPSDQRIGIKEKVLAMKGSWRQEEAEETRARLLELNRDGTSRSCRHRRLMISLPAATLCPGGAELIRKTASF